jgi:hypothetical protein
MISLSKTELPTRRLSLGPLAFAVVGIGLLYTSVPGCGDSNTVSSITVYPVKGQILLADGKPLTSGRAVLVSEEKGMEFTGVIGSDGTFEVKTSYGNGAPAGSYKVRIEYEDPTAVAAKGKATKRNVTNLPFAAKYTEEANSGLKVTIKSGDNSLEPFKLAAKDSAPQRGSEEKGRSR